MSDSAMKPLGLKGRDFALLIGATLGAMSNFAPLLSVAPMWTSTAGTGPSGLGAVTATMMATTVATQVGVAGPLKRFPMRWLFAAGGLLMGVPTFAYLLSAELPAVLAVSAVRGVGFGLVSVAGSALAAEIVPIHQRGRAVGWYGVAIGFTQLVCLPLGVWGARHLGFGAVFVIMALLAIASAPAMWAMSGRRITEEQSHAQVTTRVTMFVGPWAAMICVAAVFGGILTFLPVVLTAGIAPLALFGMSAGVVIGRWAAGVICDRAGPGRLLLPAVASAALGTAGLAWATANGAGMLAAALAALYGLGFGALQTDALVVMFRRSRAGHGLASVVWNFAYDAGTGVGGIAVGLLAGGVGFAAGFALLAGLIAVLAPLAWRDGRTELRAHETPAPAGRTPE